MASGTPGRTPLMAGNWKMNLTHPEAVALVQKLAWILADKKHDFARTEVAVIPPFTDLRSVQTLVDGDRLALRYGAPGRVRARLRGIHRRDLRGDAGRSGRSYIVVGHSERRQHHAESDDTVNAKARQAVSAGMTPIVCVGEGLDVRKAREQVPYTLAQVDGSGGVQAPRGRPARGRLRPVWAIGTGEVATPEDAQEVCAAIRGRIRETAARCSRGCRILYGGSVKAANIAGIMAQPDVDGALVGGASLQAEEFGGICRFYDMPSL
jgi:triosephosphate isomerase